MLICLLPGENRVVQSSNNGHVVQVGSDIISSMLDGHESVHQSP